MNLTRREALKVAGLGAAGVLLATGASGGESASTADSGAATAVGPAVGPASRYVLPPLPYRVEALEPVIDARTVEIHHGRHHAGYVKSANATLDRLAEARSRGDFAAIKALSRDLAFAASGVVLHDLYWTSMSAEKQAGPSGRLAEHLSATFGGVEAFKAQFAAAAKDVEGSGWAVLAWEPTLRQPVVLQVEKHQNLTVWGSVPLLVCDVWEHAYYLKYQNGRAAYVDAWVTLIDWAAAGRRFEAAVKPA